MYPSNTRDKSNIGYIFFVVFAGLLILSVSIARASLEILAQENNEGKVRVGMVNLTLYKSDGSTDPVTYKLPEVNMLPNNPFYGFKQVRDWLWINFSRTPLEKSKISLLIADKKIVESRVLFQNNVPGPAIDAATEALAKIKFAAKQAVKATDKPDEAKLVVRQIVTAGLAYKEIVVGAKDTFGMDLSKYDSLVNDLDSWNETQAPKIE